MQVPQPSWASTLRLPKSAFPPRAILADRPKYLKRCTDDFYAWQRSAPNSTSSFTLHDGPPYANGSLHIGHALNKILKDITCRVQVSRRRRVNYVPGWDCHGLPIELKALQMRKDTGKVDHSSQSGAIAVRDAARQLAQRTVLEQKENFREWAVMGDWRNSWTTMDRDFELRQLKVFQAMLEEGLIYRKLKPVYWSPSSQTALAEAELEYNPEHESTAAFVKFPLISLPPSIAKLANKEPVFALIWTTTPWTLLANKAIAVHKDLDYAIVKTKNHGIIVIGASRLADVAKSCNEDLSSILTKVKGATLTSAHYRHPASDDDSLSSPIYHGDFVSAHSGSGLVHVAPGHGMDDYSLCLANDIEPFAPVDSLARFTEDAFPNDPALFTGKDVLRDGNSAVLELLSSKGAVAAASKHKHNYPYDWRTKQPVITRATKQWFANVNRIQSETLAALDKVLFIPEGGKERLLSFIENRSEWCISRQRSWGVPIPALYQENTDTALMTPASVDHIISTIGERGIDSWWTDSEFEPAWIPPALRGTGQYRRGRETMDVWFDSGTSWTHMTKNPESNTQIADVCIEGTDQHRGWFQSSLLTKIAFQCAKKRLQTDAPFKAVVTHGFTLDQDGKKMSKSLGNVISPNEIMTGTLLPPMKQKKSQSRDSKDQSVRYDGLGPDALRLWVAGCDYTRDVVVGVPVLKAVNSNLLKLRVTFKLLTGLLDTHTPERRISFEQLGLNDQMALLALKRLDTAVKDSYAAYEYHRGVAAINQYISTDFSAGYIESVKDRMYACSIESQSRIEAQIVLWEIFRCLARVLSPITPLLVEEACNYLPQQLRDFHPIKSSREAQQYTPVSGVWENAWLTKHIPLLNAVDSTVKNAQEQARSDKKMGSSLQSFVIINVSNSHPFLQPGCGKASDIPKLLEDLLVVSSVTIGNDIKPPEGLWSYTAKVEALSHQATVVVHQPSHEKCVRCWNYTVREPEATEEPICQRCVGVMAKLDTEIVKAVTINKPKLQSLITGS